MKTLKKILKEKHPHDSNCLFAHQVVELMQLVRQETLKECAEKVSLTEDEWMILKLDKNSLDL